MKKVKKEKTKYHTYVFEYDFNLSTLQFCRWLKQKVGWKNFSWVEKGWRFSNPAIIDKIKSRYPNVEIDESIIKDYKKYQIEKEKRRLTVENANKIKKKKDSNLEIKGIKGELYPFQKLGVEFFINNNGRAILADQMGTGKTIQSLAYLIHEKINKTLVICPASVKFSWETEIKKWTELKPFIIDSKSKLDINIFNNYQIFIINYDILEKFFKFLTTVRFDCLIIDEFHYIKSNTAKRSKLTKKIAKQIPKRLLLSGTPLISCPLELFNGLQLMDSNVWNNWYHYTIKYCDGHRDYFGWNCRGSSNIEELQKRINPYFLRRTKKEVLPELPPKRFIDIPIQLPSEKKFEYDLVLNSFIEYLQNIKEKNKKEIQKSLEAEKLVKLGELRKITTMGKIETAKQIIIDIIKSEQKVVVYSVYNEPLEYLYNKFKEQSVLITGKTPELLRKKSIETFQNNPKVKIFFGGTKSAGIGITLTSASNVIFLDYSWNPADHSQAQDRLHRPGQKAESINIYQLYALNTIDDYMQKLLAKKQILFNQLIEKPGTKVKSVNLIDSLIKKIQE